VTVSLAPQVTLDFVWWLILEADEQVRIENLDDLAPRPFDPLGVGLRNYEVGESSPAEAAGLHRRCSCLSVSIGHQQGRANRTQADGGKACPFQVLVRRKEPGVVELSA
jgi:hypothetical protein